MKMLDHEMNRRITLCREKGNPNGSRVEKGYTDLYLAIQYDHELAFAMIDRTAKSDPILTEKNTNYDFDTPILGAAKHGTPELIMALLDKGADINARDKNGSGVLMAAISYRNTRMVEFLLKYRTIRERQLNKEVNDRYTLGWTPLMYACMLESIHIVRALIAAGANVNAQTRPAQIAPNGYVTNGGHAYKTALTWASIKNNEGIRSELLKHGAQNHCVHSIPPAEAQISQQRQAESTEVPPQKRARKK